MWRELGWLAIRSSSRFRRAKMVPVQDSNPGPVAEKRSRRPRWFPVASFSSGFRTDLRALAVVVGRFRLQSFKNFSSGGRYRRDSHRRGCCRPWTARTTMAFRFRGRYAAYGNRLRMARRVSLARTETGSGCRPGIRLSRSAPRRTRRQARAADLRTSLAFECFGLSFRKLTWRLTLDPAASDGLIPRD